VINATRFGVDECVELIATARAGSERSADQRRGDAELATGGVGSDEP